MVQNVQARLINCRNVLRRWSRVAYPNSRKRIDALMKEVEGIKSGILNSEKVIEIERITKEVEKLWEIEEKYWGQRSRLNWLKFGDQNSRFFHAVTAQRRQRNKVTRIRNGNGEWLEKVEEVGDCFKSFFAELFATAGHRDLSYALSFVKRQISDEINDDLTKPVSMIEVKEAAFELGRDKAPGPDGFSGWFFHFSWDEVKFQIFDMVRDFMENGCDLGVLNETNIVLIPKVDKPEWVSQFRPIGLCNFVYKIISKVLVNRMQSLLPMGACWIWNW